jgi:hypothetical protein
MVSELARPSAARGGVLAHPAIDLGRADPNSELSSHAIERLRCDQAGAAELVLLAGRENFDSHRAGESVRSMSSFAPIPSRYRATLTAPV